LGDQLAVAMAALNAEASVDLRVNTLKATRQQVMAALRKEEMEPVPTPFAADGVRLKKRGALIAMQAFRDGWFEIQEMSKFLFENFQKAGICGGITNTGLPTGTGGDENYMISGNGNYFEYHILGTQTILYPTWTLATGLNISMDATDNDGVEWTNGITSKSKCAFTVGTDGAFHFKVRFSIADVSGSDDCAIGFRKAEAYQANIDDYDEMAALNVISGAINIETILNAGATTTTDTTDTWADAETHVLEVYVSAAGVVTYKIDGAAPTTTAAFTFDDAEVVVPFFYLLNSSDLHGNIVLTAWECGLD